MPLREGEGSFAWPKKRAQRWVAGLWGWVISTRSSSRRRASRAALGKSIMKQRSLAAVFVLSMTSLALGACSGAEATYRPATGGAAGEGQSGGASSTGGAGGGGAG